MSATPTSAPAAKPTKGKSKPSKSFSTAIAKSHVMTADSRARIIASKEGCNSRVQHMVAPQQGTAWADESSSKAPPKCSIVIDKELQAQASSMQAPQPRQGRRKSKTSSSSSSSSPPSSSVLASLQERPKSKPTLLELKEDYFGLFKDFCFDNKSCLDNSTAKPLPSMPLPSLPLPSLPLGRHIRKTSDEYQSWPPQSLSPTSPSSSVSAASPTWPPPASSSSSASSTSGEPAQLFGLASVLNQMDMFGKLPPLNASFFV